MTDTHQTPLNDEWINAFLTAPTRNAQDAMLREAKLYHAKGLSRLLDRAMSLARVDPGKARHLAIACADAASKVGARFVVAQATYVEAQTHAIRGELNTALDLIRTAREQYQELGDELEALRTNVGLMHVLNELGRHQDALDAGQQILDAVQDRLGEDGASEHATLLAAMAQQNRGICYETIGRYEDALDVYAAAEAYFAKLGMRERIGDIRNNRGIVLVHLGRISEALQAFDTAATIREEAGLTLLRAQTLSNLGDAYLQLGDYSRSLDAFEQARRLFDSLDALASEQILLRKTADAYLALNLYPEAEALYREAEELLRDAGMTDHRARALWGLGATLRAQSAFEEAEAMLAQAAELFSMAGNVPMLCSVMLEQAALQDRRGEREVARATALDALTRVDGEGWPVQAAYANMRVADLLLPDVEAAELYLDAAAQQIADQLSLPTLQYRVNRRLGRLRLLQGRTDEAETLLTTAVEEIESLRGTLTQESIRTSFLRDKTAAYEDLVRLHLMRGDDVSIAHGFAVAEQAKSRTLVDLLTGIIDPAPSSDRGVKEEIRTLEADLHAVYNEFLAVDRRSGHRSLLELQERARDLERAISRLRLRTEGDTDVADPFASPLALHALREQIPNDIVLLAYHVVDDEILAFVNWDDHVHVVRGLSDVPTVQELLQRLYTQWDRFGAGVGFVERHVTQLERSARRVLEALYDEVVAPVRSVIDRATTEPAKLAIVPHGILHQVPFHALYDGSAYLIDRYEFSYAPSATVLALCQQRSRRTMRRALIMGLADPLIPAVNTEVHTVSKELRSGAVETHVSLNGSATIDRLRAEVGSCDLVHLACHGIFRADNPMFSALKLHDGWLTAADVMTLEVTDAVVTLSACESGRSQVIVGDEVIGLPRAFLGAGASTVVVSLWLVHDETTATFMREWYRRLQRGDGRAEALRAAQVALKDEYPHPYYWAPFMLIGQR